MPPVLITSVQPASQTPGMWIITDSNKVRHATKDALAASLADRCRVKGTKVWIDSWAGGGWHYRSLNSIKPATDPVPQKTGMPPERTTPAPEPVCPQYGSRCQWVARADKYIQCRRTTCLHVKREDRYGYR